jgi:excisionase family DNA binding protein
MSTKCKGELILEYHLKNRKEVEKFIFENVLTTSEATKMLGISRSRMSQLISSGKITPVKKLRGDSLFLRQDIEEKAKELEKLRKKYRPYESE